jgi:hypothetical protein
MKTMTESQLGEVAGGADSIQNDLGEFAGGVSGWMRSNPVAWVLLGPGIGGLAAVWTGVKEMTL